jgi:hypothetical protein
MGAEFAGFREWPDEPDWPRLIDQYSGASLLFPSAAFIDAVSFCRGGLAYLATPYSREAVDLNGIWSAVRSDDMARQASKWVLHCAVNGVSAISPIAQAVAMMDVDGAHTVGPLDHSFWMNWCMPILRASSSVIIPPIAGWDRSIGVWQEAVWALRHNVPVHIIREGSEYELRDRAGRSK